MSCCGNKRAALAQTRSMIDAADVSRSAPPSGSAVRATRFEYRGGRSLTVVGAGTGYRYRFVGHGAQLSVDPRDSASLAAVPELREV